MSILALSTRQMRDEDIKFQIEEIKAATYINLSSNYIGYEGIKTLTEAIEKSKKLTELKLWNNKIRDDGAKVLAEAFKQSKTLKRLDLGFNNIGPEGAKALAELIKENQSLEELGLVYNNIGYEGAASLVEALKKSKSTTIKYVDVNYEYKPEIGAALLQIKMRRLLFAIIPSETIWYNTAVGRFLRRDGDHAIGTKIFRFLMG